MASVLENERLKNIGLILLSLLFLPLDTSIVVLSCVSCLIRLAEVEKQRKTQRDRHGFIPKTILVTGVGMSKGLTIARSFYIAGHNVIGADFEPGLALACGRFSRSLKSFHRLQPPNAQSGSGPYIDNLLRIVRREHVDLWISCSGVASAIEDGEAKEAIETQTSCKAIQFDTATTQTLHEKHSFIEHTREIGLTVPDTHYVTDREAVETALRQAPADRKYIMKPVGMDDANRGDLTLLPKATTTETSAHLAKLKISKESTWILQQYIRGPEYCTHSIVINGRVKAFVACPSAELLMHYEALPSSSKLSQAMLHFTERYAAHGAEGFTGHLSFDFMVDKSQMDGLHSVRKGEELVLYPIECNPRAHTAVVLFNGSQAMSDAYLSLLEPRAEPTLGPKGIAKPQYSRKYYWVGRDLVELLVQPLLALLLQQSIVTLVFLPDKLETFINHLVYWRDGTFERWDPLPWWWLYHGYWPARFLQCLRSGSRWSRINVSTTKMFMS